MFDLPRRLLQKLSKTQISYPVKAGHRKRRCQRGGNPLYFVVLSERVSSPSRRKQEADRCEVGVKKEFNPPSKDLFKRSRTRQLDQNECRGAAR